MFDLEEAIADWARLMAVEGIQSTAVLSELESHLRDDIDEQVLSGIEPSAAFQAAIGRIGKARPLQDEFEKVDFAKAGGKAKSFILALGGIATSTLNPPMTSPNPAVPLEPRWSTYLKAGAFLAPATCLWWFSIIFIFPKVQTIARDAGVTNTTPHQMIAFLAHYGLAISGVILGSLILLEWRSNAWPRYRRASVMVAVFLVNAAIMLLITVMLTLTMMAVPALFRTP
jgi:hypothetical protein